MMWRVTLIFVSCVATQVASHEIKLECNQSSGFPPERSERSPSRLVGLKSERVKGQNKLNISWAINIDSSIDYLNSTVIKIAGKLPYLCIYKPHLADANLTETKQKWFHLVVNVTKGFISIEAANVPFPPRNSDRPYKVTTIEVLDLETPSVTPESSYLTVNTAEVTIQPTASGLNIQQAIYINIGGLAFLMILTSCYIIYKSFGSNIAKSLGFQNVPTVHVPVLVVYPAENSAFQQAVVALAEFLQWHGSCSVTIDMWQQGKIAELGPMRWLAEQAKAAARVLIVCPQVGTPSHCPPNHSFPEHSIPAAAHDLYPLILNIVASYAKSTSDLAKFWVVQLGAQKDKTPCILAPELRACKSFCLMKDLNKLCKSLHAQRQDSNKIVADQIFKQGVSFSEMDTVKLREAVEKLRHQPSDSTEVQPLKSVVITV